mgnify:CR=1 FL=1
MDEYIVVKALENGVNIIGLQAARIQSFIIRRNLIRERIFLAQFTDVTNSNKDLNGAAEIYTKHGKLMSDAR